MNRIRLLSEQVANQIAAGEVVERPASVVKELVENALDAQANRITVEIQAGGRSLIRITDDGIGMNRDDALLCLERHATSKIQRAEDLSAIASFGFRGEALPSIASVSRFTLTTRERDSSGPDACQVVVSGGKISEVRAAAGAAGTVVEVRQIFYNLPARRKFLKGEETERAHIQHYLTLAALAHPGVGFTFINDQRVVWQLPPLPADDSIEARLKSLQERFAAIHGGRESLLAVHATRELPPVRIRGEDQMTAASELRLWGWIGSPGVSRGSRDEQYLFVNRRPVDSRALNFALLEGYHTSLMKGRYPVCALFLEIDPSEVDVNIHPAKREVRFHQEQAIRGFVAEAVRTVLVEFNAGRSSPGLQVIRPHTRPEPPPPIAHPQFQFPERKPGPTPPSPTATVHPATPVHAQASTASAPPPIPPPSPAVPGGATPPATASPPPSAPLPSPAPVGALPPQPSQPPVAPDPAAPPATGPVPLLQVPLRYLGILSRLYVLFESDRGLVLMDQHAAHERVLFEQMLRRLETGDAPSQRLLLPETVELGLRDAQFLRENLDQLARLGVGLSEFGERTFLLDALPPFVKPGAPKRFVIGLIDELKAVGQGINTLRLGEHMIAKTVCRHAVKANDSIGEAEVIRLLQDLGSCEMPYTCPHGRPTLIEMSLKELEKKFGRTV